MNNTGNLATVLLHAGDDFDYFKATAQFVWGNDPEATADDAEFWAWLLMQEVDSEAVREVYAPEGTDPEEWTAYLASFEAYSVEHAGYHA